MYNKYLWVFSIYEYVQNYVLIYLKKYRINFKNMIHLHPWNRLRICCSEAAQCSNDRNRGVRNEEKG